MEDLEIRVDADAKPDGTKQFPGKTCRDIQMCFPESKTGEWNYFEFLFHKFQLFYF